MKSKKVSLKDIADALKISKATVSIVLNGKGDLFNISKERQVEIKLKARELNYVPNYFAKSIRQGKPLSIGLILPDILNPFYTALAHSIQEQFTQIGYSTYILNTNEDEEMEIEMLREMFQYGVDGIVICPVNEHEVLSSVLNETHIPYVFVDRKGDDSTNFVGVNNYQEAFEMVSFFKKKPKKVAIIYTHNNLVSTLEERFNGIADKCREIKAELKLVEFTFNCATNDSKLKRMVKEGFDSFITLNNLTLYGLLEASKNGVKTTTF